MRLAVAVCAVGRVESVTSAVNGKLPVTVGVPEITPVVAAKLNPAGRAPELMLQVYGAVPPLSESVVV